MELSAKNAIGIAGGLLSLAAIAFVSGYAYKKGSQFELPKLSLDDAPADAPSAKSSYWPIQPGMTYRITGLKRT